MSCFLFRRFGTLDTLACIYPLCLARRGGIICYHNILRRFLLSKHHAITRKRITRLEISNPL
jgi:hypothetical protein